MAGRTDRPAKQVIMTCAIPACQRQGWRRPSRSRTRGASCPSFRMWATQWGGVILRSALLRTARFGGYRIAIGGGGIEDLHFRVRQPACVTATALVVVCEASAGWNQAANYNVF